MVLLDVVCPLGVGEGELISVLHPAEGAAFEVPLPPGVVPGASFEVELPEESAQEAAALCEVSQRLSVEQAAALRHVLSALCDFDELFDWIATHCREFREWNADGEQQLNWQVRHDEYTALVERHIEAQLAELGSSGADLHALLSEVIQGGADPRADTFLSRLLALTSYERFCRMMARSRCQDALVSGATKDRPPRARGRSRP